MKRSFRFAVLSLVLIGLGLIIGPAGAQETPESPEVGVCLPGVGYASGCDVDQDGDIDIFDIQLTAGRWNSSGAYTSSHTHWGETWTDVAGQHGLRLEHAASSGFTYGAYGQSASSDGIGLVGRTTASAGGMGVYGRSDGVGGYGVYGAAAGSSGENYGVFGYSASSGGYAGYFSGSGADAVRVQNGGSGRGIQAYALNDTAVWARTDNGLAGVDGWNSSATGRGVSGYASAATGATHGVWGQSASSSGTGVLGWASAASGYTTGVYGESSSTDGKGVFGVSTASSGYNYGLYGASASPNGKGVYGVNNATTGLAIGVYGVTGSASGLAGYFVGDVQVVGTLGKSAGNFKIDHPLDPANQYLYHSFVESPDMMNIYNGNATLDAHGEAWVELPDWFQALNRDFRYQLTPIGGWAPLYVAQKVQGNRFQIAGGEPGMEVSWQVTGIRQDAYANAHRVPVEEPKPADERGLYLHPTELGQPAELGLDAQRQAARPEALHEVRPVPEQRELP
jgi:hypothetical protein